MKPTFTQATSSRTVVVRNATAALDEQDACIFKADVICDGSPVRGDGGGVGGSRPCQSEIDGLQDAVTPYWVADAAMIGCYAGPLACAGVTLYLLYTAHQIDVWDSRLDACLAGL